MTDIDLSDLAAAGDGSRPLRGYLASPAGTGPWPAVVMIHAVTSILMGRPDRGMKDLANPVIGNGYDSQLWKGLAFARQGKWADAREKFKNAEFSVATLPMDVIVPVVRSTLKPASVLDVRSDP